MRTRRGSARVAAAPLGGPKGGRVPPRRGEGFDRTTPWSREPRRFVGSAWGRGTRRHAENARPPPEGDPGGRRGVMAPLSCANGAKSPGFNPPGRRRPWGPREGAPGTGPSPPGQGVEASAATPGAPRAPDVEGPPAVAPKGGGRGPPGARARVPDGAGAPTRPNGPRGRVGPRDRDLRSWRPSPPPAMGGRTGGRCIGTGRDLRAAAAPRPRPSFPSPHGTWEGEAGRRPRRPGSNAGRGRGFGG